MYLDYFELNEFPFTLTPNTKFFCTLSTHSEALNVINVSLENGEGFIKIIGEVGTGKTLLCRKLLNSLDAEKYISVYIVNPNLDCSAFYEAILKELGVPYNKKTDQHELLLALSDKLLSLYKSNKHVIVIVDEAQGLPDKTLEALRLLSNIETESSKLLHIVLFGQPELEVRLNKPKLRQLKQRIAFSYQLRRLNLREIEDYLHFRLKTAGFNYNRLFTRAAHKLLFTASTGIPRLINVLCHKALLAAYGYGEKRITAKTMLLAIKDTNGIFNMLKKRLGAYIVLAVLFLILGIEIFVVLRNM
jgi:MSHA biogenesis protein MshM